MEEIKEKQVKITGAKIEFKGLEKGEHSIHFITQSFFISVGVDDGGIVIELDENGSIKDETLADMILEKTRGRKHVPLMTIPESSYGKMHIPENYLYLPSMGMSDKE